MRVQVRGNRGEWTFAETDKLLVIHRDDTRPRAVRVEELRAGDIVVGLGKILRVDVMVTREEMT